MNDFSKKKQQAIKAVQEQDRLANEARKNFRRTTSATDDFDQPWALAGVETDLGHRARLLRNQVRMNDLSAETPSYSGNISLRFGV